MADHVIDKLSAFADGELDPAERELVQRHLRGCPACERALTEIRAIVSWAPEYRGLPPTRDVWPELSTRLAPRTSPGGRKQAWHGRRVTIRVPVLLAASILLILLSAGAMWLTRENSAGKTPMAAIPSGGREWNASLATITDAKYATAVNELEGILALHDSALDPETLRVIRSSLATIDSAISQARAAVLRDSSSNDYLKASIALNMRRKLDILRTAAKAATAKT